MLALMRRFSWISLGVLAAGCAMQEGADVGDDGTPSGYDIAATTGLAVVSTDNDVIPPLDEEGCPAIYAQDHVPTFELTLGEDVVAALYEDWMFGTEGDKLDKDETPYHPVAEFRYGDIVIRDARIRLRGNPTYWLEQNKMQFQVSFDEIDKGGRFLGQRKMLFDAATYNRHFVRDRLSLWIMRQAGITAPCANNARLMINGDYYGLYTSLEKLDNVFLARNFEDPTGDLWKRTNYELKTNLATATTDRINVLRRADPDTTALSEIEAILDVEQAILVWAADAIIPNSDGPWAGGFNFYFYDDPTRGKMVLLPWDLDNTFTRLDFDVDPYTFTKPERFRGRPLYDIALADDGWFSVYVQTLAQVVDQAYDKTVLHQKIDQWSAQIQSAAFDDLNKPFTNQKYYERIGVLKQFVADRADYLNGWLQCWQDGGTRNSNGSCVASVGAL